MSEQENELLYFEDEDGGKYCFRIVETTTIAGKEYLMVQEDEPDEEDAALAYIMRKVGDDEEDAYYEFVDDEDELDSVFAVFEQLLEDIDFIE